MTDRRQFLASMMLSASGISTGSLELGQVLSRSYGAVSPMEDVEGKVAFITGGSSGIGLGIARAFVEAGMRVVIAYRSPAHVEEAMRYFEGATRRVHAICVDVTNRAGMEQAAAETLQVFGKIHVLVNNAGVLVTDELSRTSYEDWDWLMNVNLTGVFNGIRAFLPHIQQHGEGGHVITTSSVLGLFVVGAGAAAYCVSKFALVGLTETLRAELANTRIGVSLFCPGVVKSNLFQSDRNRPEMSKGGAVTHDLKFAELKEETQRSAISSDPLEAGRMVLSGMKNNDLYILTHPEFQPLIQLRHAALIASMPSGPYPTQSRIAMVQSMLPDSIYARECSRKFCKSKKVPRTSR